MTFSAVIENTKLNNSFVSKKETLYELDEQLNFEAETVGEILSVQDGVAFVAGLGDVRVGEFGDNGTCRSFTNIKVLGLFGNPMRMVYPCLAVGSKKTVISRTMYSSTASRIASRCLPSVKNSRMYAMYTCNESEKSATDPQGNINNPTMTKKEVSFRHNEFHRTRCVEEGCTEKICTDLCSTLVDRKAIGNITSSNSIPTNGDSVLVENVSPTLMNGRNGPQHARVYTTAHNTSQTREFKSGTQKMHDEPDFIPTLIKYADNK
jgi:hypothetical protein